MKNFKNYLALFGIAVSFLTLGVSCNKNKNSSPDVTPSEPTSENQTVTDCAVNLPQSVTGGSITANSTTVKKGGTVVLTVTCEQYFTLESLTSNGQPLTVEEDGTVTIYNVYNDLNIEASFVGIDVKVSFSYEDLTFNDVTLKYDGAYSNLPTITDIEEGYEFVGWYTQENGEGIKVTEYTLVSNPENHTLYGHVAAKKYNVNFDTQGGTINDEYPGVGYNCEYGELPIPTKDGSVFVGWIDEDNNPITSTTIHSVNSDINLIATYAEIEINVSKYEKITNMPNVDDGVLPVNVKLTSNGNDVTSNYQLSLLSTNELIVVDGMTLKVAANAYNEKASVVVKVNDVVIHTFIVEATDYEGLGYSTVSNKNEFFAMTGNGKYVLTADIDLENQFMCNTTTWQEYINTLEKDAVIDGNGHFVSNGYILSGWNHGWIYNVKGTIKNIAFLNIKSPDIYPYNTGLIGTLDEGGTLENVYLQYKVLVDGNNVIAECGGTLVGGFFDGIIKDCIVDVAYADGLTSVSNTGAIVGKAGAYAGQVINSYAISTIKGVNGYAFEVENGVWAAQTADGSGTVFNTTYEVVSTVLANNKFSALWTFDMDGISYNGKLVRAMEERLSVEVDSSIDCKYGAPQYISYLVYIYGKDSDEYTATYQSSNEEIFTIDEEGLINPVAYGSATLTITIDGDYVVEVEINVVSPYSVEVTVEEEYVVTQGTVNLEYKVFEYDTEISEYSISFESTDETVFTVTNEGVMTLLATGEASLIVKVNDIQVASIEVNVKADEYTYISNAEQWRTLISANPEGKFKLNADIDLAGGWVTSGDSATLANTFRGEIDGQGHIVSAGWMPGGWNKGLFTYNYGTIKNIAFKNIYATNQVYDTALVSFHYGVMENVYVDYILVNTKGYDGTGGVLAAYLDTPGVIRNCIVNVRKETESTSVAPNYGSIIGKSCSWQSFVYNCYAIVNDTGIKDIAYTEGAPGITKWHVDTNGSNQFADYATFKANANVTGYDSNVWAFTNTTISFFGRVVYEVL